VKVLKERKSVESGQEKDHIFIDLVESDVGLIKEKDVKNHLL
jgi:hypothetical protein